MEHKPALMLNTDMTPIKIISWKRAICLSIIGKEIPGEGVSILKYYDDYVTSAGGLVLPIPAVVMTNRYINYKRKVYINKQTLFYRDNGQCQYCSKEISFNEATIDHIVPKKTFKTKSDATTWDNVILACRSCNIKKGGRTPEQARMTLLKNPTPANPHALRFRKKYKEWEEFLWYNLT